VGRGRGSGGGTGAGKEGDCIYKQREAFFRERKRERMREMGKRRRRRRLCLLSIVFRHKGITDEGIYHMLPFFVLFEPPFVCGR
jgi:hypothetical protein